jgi:hypothetical protein|tara:strand:- start:63 stop:515 length:453 start_codon:yes stop_codon:yes gene_type:complete
MAEKLLTLKQFRKLSAAQLDAMGNDRLMKHLIKFKLLPPEVFSSEPRDYEKPKKAKGGLSKKTKGYAKGGLKSTAGKKGLSMLPTSVRNKMGYMKDGGSTMKGKKTKGYAKGGMKTKGYAKGGMKKPKMMGGGMNMKGKKTKGYARGGKR